MPMPSCSLDAQLQAQGKAQGTLHAEGTLTDRQAKIGVQLADIELALAEPYLRQFLRPQASARLNAAAALDWARGDAPRLAVALSTLRIDDFRLADAPAKAARSAAGAAAGPAGAAGAERPAGRPAAAAHRHRYAEPAQAFRRTGARCRRRAQRQQVAGRARVRQRRPPRPTPRRAAPWQLALRDFKLDGGRARLADAALPAGAIEIAALRAGAQGLAWPATAPLNTQLSASLAVVGNAAGAAPSAASRLDWRGRISPQPLGASGQLRLERFPVHVFEPYFGAGLPVLLQRLEAGFQGQLDLKQLPGGLAGQVRGEALLADLRVLARPAAGGGGRCGRA